jgi:mycoredoxin
MFRSSPRTRRPDISDAGARVAVYGTGWCAQSQMVRRLLDRLGIPYVYYDLERDPGATQRVSWWTGGYASHPTVQIGGEILVEPSLDEVQWALARKGLI